MKLLNPAFSLGHHVHYRRQRLIHFFAETREVLVDQQHRRDVPDHRPNHASSSIAHSQEDKMPSFNPTVSFDYNSFCAILLYMQPK